jgi:hypothetical protein
MEKMPREAVENKPLLPACDNSPSEVLGFDYRTVPPESIRFERKKAGDNAGLSRNTLGIS